MIGPGACLLPPRRVWPDVKVSVLMPVYNVERFLPQALDSILGQTHRNFDVVLINDGSTDGTAAICRHYAEQDSRILLFDHAENRGLVWCLNFGLDHCDGTYVARADGDDWYFPGRFQDQIAAMEEGGLIATSGAYIVIDDDGTLLRLQTVHNRRPDLDHIPVRERYLPHPFLMVRRDAIGQVGGYRHVVHSEDTDLYYRLSELGEIRNLPAVLGHYRIHPTSISGASVANGRVQAVSSQLAALSAKLRAAGTSDIENWEEIAATVTRERDDFQSMMAALRPKLPPLREADVEGFQKERVDPGQGQPVEGCDHVARSYLHRTVPDSPDAEPRRRQRGEVPAAGSLAALCDDTQGCTSRARGGAAIAPVAQRPAQPDATRLGKNAVAEAARRGWRRRARVARPPAARVGPRRPRRNGPENRNGEERSARSSFLRFAIVLPAKGFPCGQK